MLARAYPTTRGLFLLLTHLACGAVMATAAVAQDESPSPQEAEGDLVWETLGVELLQADGRLVTSAAPEFAAGLYVTGVRSGGPAERAGWQPGDILVGLGRYRVEDHYAVRYVAGEWQSDTGADLPALLLREGVVRSVPLASTASRQVASRPAEAPGVAAPEPEVESKPTPPKPASVKTALPKPVSPKPVSPPAPASVPEPSPKTPMVEKPVPAGPQPPKPTKPSVTKPVPPKAEPKQPTKPTKPTKPVAPVGAVGAPSPQVAKAGPTDEATPPPSPKPKPSAQAGKMPTGANPTIWRRLGVHVEPVSTSGGGRGLRVVELEAGSPAGKVWRPGDVLLEVGAEPLSEVFALEFALELSPGTVDYQVRRGDEVLSGTLELRD